MNTTINPANKVTLNQFKDIVAITTNSEIGDLEKQIELLKILTPDLSEDEMLDLPIDEFEQLMASLDFMSNDTQISQKIVIDDVEYELEGNSKSFDFTVRQMLKIQKEMKIDNVNYLHFMMAILYSNKTSTIEERAKIFFEKLTIDYAMPFISILSKKYSK